MDLTDVTDGNRSKMLTHHRCQGQRYMNNVWAILHIKRVTSTSKQHTSLLVRSTHEIDLCRCALHMCTM